MKQSTNKFTAFLRRNLFYFVLGLCILAVGLSVTFVVMQQGIVDNSQTQNPPVVNPTPDVPSDEIIDPNPDDVITPTPDQPSTDVTVTKMVFIMPVSNCDVLKDYTETMVFNSTLNRYSNHLAIDFSAPQGTSVVCVFDGVVENVERSYLTGITVTVSHKDGVKSIYNSLGEVEDLSVGQALSQGQVIGTVGTSNLQESNDGAHLHFEVTENGEKINPLTYLVIEEK